MLRHLSIRHKLTLLQVGLVGIVLSAVSAATLITDVRAIRTRLADRYSTLATVVAANSAVALSIADVDPSSAQAVVSDLTVEQNVLYAALYDSDETEVARYQSTKLGDVTLTPPRELGPTYTTDGFLDVVQEVTLKDGRVIGRIYLRVTLDVLHSEIHRKLAIMAAVFAGALLFALLLSIVLQRLISDPILRLAQLAARVSNEHDYSLRAIKTSHDELGLLCDGFNAMLTEIQQRDAELRIHRLRLEETVERRTWMLKARTDELTRSNTELEQFAYISSHDLQEPLRKIQAFGDMLTNQFRDVLGDEGRDYLQRMQGAAKRMQGLINELLNYSRITTKAQPFVSVNLSDVAQLVLTDLETRIHDTGGRVELEPLPTLEGDPTQMRQLLQNLIGNALKYHRKTVPPVVKVQSRLLDPGDRPFPSDGPPIQSCEITVEDNGIGFEQKYVDRIFAPFERLHGRSEYEGTGMGLAICRKIVERHGGTITARSVPNQGSTFVVIIPLQQPKGAPKDEPV
ncbi:MAG: sensor histidine kinase [Planctomycetaceae bacterium]